MNDDWMPIKDYPLPEFDPVNWWRSGTSVLVWNGWAQIANYSYTQTGRGRWRSHNGTLTPTHWMPLPDPPKDTKDGSQQA
jgi:hypothetical protein